MHKFLLASDYNIEKALNNFNAYMRARVSANIDNLITEDFSRLDRVRQLYPRQFYHHDKFGRPVLIERPGMANLKDLFKVEQF